MLSYAKNFVILASLLLLHTGCAINQTQVNADREALNNWQKIPAQEAEYYKTKHTDLPDNEKNGGKPIWGLALSGGGQRSASVSIGFLEALHKANILDKLDVISTVSGGSYAAYWWFTKKHIAKNKLGDAEENILANVKTPLFSRNFTCNQCQELLIAGVSSNKCYYEDINACNEGDKKIERYQNHRFYFNTSNHSNLLTFAQQVNHFKYMEIAGKAVGWLPTIPMHWIANGLFDMRLNLNLFQNYYENGLERDYGFYPKALNECNEPYNEPLKCYANTTSRFSLDSEIASKDLFDKTIGPNTLPYWVINTTSEYSHTKLPKIFRNLFNGAYSDRLYDNVYEFTPLQQGSPRFGYFPIEANQQNDAKQDSIFNVKLSRQVAISGASIDDLPRLANVGADVINLSLGQYINNPAVADRSSANLHRFIPFPFYWLNQYTHDETSPFIYLSDGGHSDNLGAYSLIRRGVKNIIVLDAEHEKSSKGLTIAQFEALNSLRTKLKDEQGICLNVDEAFLKSFNFKKSANSVFKIPVYKCDCPADKQNIENQIATIYYVKLSIDYDSSEFIDKKNSDGELSKGQNIYDVCRDVKQDMSHEAIPYDEMPLNQQTERYSCTTRYYASKTDAKNGKFPHDSTADIFYDVSQFASYTALGYDLGRELVGAMQNNDLKYFEVAE